jgi:hypothetical protein
VREAHPTNTFVSFVRFVLKDCSLGSGSATPILVAKSTRKYLRRRHGGQSLKLKSLLLLSPLLDAGLRAEELLPEDSQPDQH